MVERIKITEDRIVTRKVDNSISFDTNNLYLKTDPAGTLKVGGYERCPVISGYVTFNDKTDFGGFPLIIINYGLSPQSFSGYIVNGNLQVASPLDMSAEKSFEAVSSLANITNNGNIIGTYRRLYITFITFIDYEQRFETYDVWSIRDLSIAPNFNEGFVVFENPQNNYLYTVSNSNVLHEWQHDISYHISYGIYILYTKSPVSLSIAVTP